ncbi:hypothetical protein GA0070604_4045 [Micromonospora eburnea]|uniref:Uncharacterized protein n=1 Tax=Micromonospora eburnea TaxID=227316 RepID=A0A1C6UZZ1_9ACTN|nr:hypothetical protein GA0070604_4045 [Micromonospora eburnea]
MGEVLRHDTHPTSFGTGMEAPIVLPCLVRYADALELAGTPVRDDRFAIRTNQSVPTLIKTGVNS